MRSRGAIAEFKRATGYPDGRPGYRVDHNRPLCLVEAGLYPCDVPWAMTWQRADDATAKDKQEVTACAALKGES